jgi:hypothetical protein
MAGLFGVCAFGAIVSGVLSLSIPSHPLDDFGPRLAAAGSICAGVVFGLAAFAVVGGA